MSYNRKRSASSISGGSKAVVFKSPMRQTVLMGGSAFKSRYQQSRLSIAELKDNTVRSLTVVPAFGTTTASTGVLLNGLSQGTTATTRIGRRITMKSMYIQYQINLLPTTTGSSPLRFLVVYDAQANGAAPAILDIVLTDELASPMNLGNSRRFKVLCDEVVPCIGTAGPQSYMFKRYIKLGNLNTEFNSGNAGTIADITSGSIYVYTWGSSGWAVATPGAVLYSRIRFQDS